MDDITRTDGKQLALSLRGQGLRPRTVRKVVGTMSAIFCEAVDDDKPATNPALGLRKVYRSADFTNGSQQKPVNPPTREELVHLLATARDHTIERARERYSIRSVRITRFSSCLLVPDSDSVKRLCSSGETSIARWGH